MILKHGQCRSLPHKTTPRTFLNPSSSLSCPLPLYPGVVNYFLSLVSSVLVNSFTAWASLICEQCPLSAGTSAEFCLSLFSKQYGTVTVCMAFPLYSVSQINYMGNCGQFIYRYYTVLYKGSEHPQILVSEKASVTNQFMDHKDDCPKRMQV